MPGQQYDNVPGQHVPGQHVPTAGNTQGHRTMGDKVENAVGSLVGSNALRAKGMEKEREAQAFNIQGQELKEAERLEQEALTHRERAVAHGRSHFCVRLVPFSDSIYRCTSREQATWLGHWKHGNAQQHHWILNIV